MAPIEDRKITRRSLLLSTCMLPAALSFWNSVSEPAEGAPDYEIRAVPLTRVDVLDQFWSSRMEANRAVSIWHCFDRMTRNDDFGVPKLIEGAAYMLAKQPDPKLEAYVDDRIDKLVAALTPRLADPDKAVRVPGHFLEAGAAYCAITGKRKMLDCALQAADVIAANFGPGKKTYIAEHEGLAIGLVQLFRETDHDAQWKSAKFFIDQRGKADYPRQGVYATDRTYDQDQAPVVAQREAVGHCVRATFLYIPLTDIAALTGQPEYQTADDAIWHDVVFRKIYLTGSIGSIRFHEQFGAPYELPNLSSWSETCASYGNAVWNHRMFLLHKDGAYIDVMERVLYNGFADGVSLKGDRFFYQNPLKSFGDYDRFEWINTPCCPPNVVRLTASIGSYIYAESADSIYVNLFIGSKAKVNVGKGNTVELAQQTRYPWDGAVRIMVGPQHEQNFAIRVRIPGWARNQVLPSDLYRYTDRSDAAPKLSVNGAPARIELENGYAKIERKWRKGDVIQLDLPMPVRRVRSRPEALEDREMVALERGPVVYCAEWPDNGGHALNLMVPDAAEFNSEWRGDLLGGSQVITGTVKALGRKADGSLETQPHPLVAIPYHRWANRGMGEMAVWLARDPKQAWIAPVPPDPIAKVDSSGGVPKAWTGYNDQNSDMGALYDGKDPISSADESYRYFKMRPAVGSPAWIEYQFKEPTKISSSQVYWFDDRRFCVIPQSWRILYREGDRWVPVSNAGPYSVAKDQFNAVSFAPVTTTAMRIEIEPVTTSYKAGDIGPPDAMFIRAPIQWRELGLLEWRVA
ncbi:MAG TPA: beta-L-arabinofuranosidase domain-containing protein [Candidatus Acidoferrales bacterium]|nr:beta-L-arabinofuranosidase domain-containing protein [Candidatus Acidoferrales bacterium]